MHRSIRHIHTHPSIRIDGYPLDPYYATCYRRDDGRMMLFYQVQFIKKSSQNKIYHEVV